MGDDQASGLKDRLRSGENRELHVDELAGNAFDVPGETGTSRAGLSLGC